MFPGQVEPNHERPLRRWKMRLSLLLLCTTLVAASSAYWRGKAVFTARCIGNANPFSACWCTYDALADLPENYRDLAISWAHDSSTAYATNVMYLIAREARRVSIGYLHQIANVDERKKLIEKWVRRTGSIIGARVLQAAAPKIAGTLAMPAVVLPPIYDAAAEYIRASSILDRHCARPAVFLVQVDETRKAAESAMGEITAGTIDAVIEAGRTTAQVSTNAMHRTWRWLTSWR